MMKYPFFYLMSILLLITLSGCQAISNWQPTAGPTKRVIEQQVDTAGTGLTIIEIDNQIIRQATDFSPNRRFSDYFRTSSGFNNHQCR